MASASLVSTTREPAILEMFAAHSHIIDLAEILLLNDNAFTGQLRDSFGSLPNLDYFDVTNNEFTGFLPSTMFDVSTLQFAYFSNNSFVGTIPSNLANANSLRELYLNGNELRGTIPDISMGQLPFLAEFLIHDNNLHGTMPTTICLRRSVGALEDLWGDCGPPNPPEIICDFPGCCTRCSPSEPGPTGAPVLSLIPTETPSSLPTSEPSSSPSKMPTIFDGCHERNRTEVLLERLSEVTNPSLLLDQHTPQGQAFTWLALRDVDMDVCSYPTLDQRYSLAVLYFATGGRSWVEQSQWVSGAAECNWYQISCDAFFNTVVVKINLGKISRSRHLLQDGS